MAAWSEHEDGPWVETRSALGQEMDSRERTDGDFRTAFPDDSKLYTPLPTPCPVCQYAMLGEHCLRCGRKVSTPDATSEPFPTEVWTFFSDPDLDQLVTDACAEMGRRELGRKS